MKSIALLSVAALSVATAAGAQEFGHVLSSTPVIGQVALPQQVCHDTTVVVPGRQSGAGRDEIQAAYRRLIQRVHPDQGGSSDLAARINQARDVLLRR